MEIEPIKEPLKAVNLTEVTRPLRVRVEVLSQKSEFNPKYLSTYCIYIFTSENRKRADKTDGKTFLFRSKQTRSGISVQKREFIKNKLRMLRYYLLSRRRSQSL